MYTNCIKIIKLKMTLCPINYLYNESIWRPGLNIEYR